VEGAVNALPLLRRCLEPLRPYVPGRGADEVARAHAPARVSRLGSNENPLGPGPRAIAALRRHADGVSVYPDPSCRELRAALARGAELGADGFFVANGSDEVLLLIAAAFLEPGQGVLTSAHTFFNYEFVARIFDGDIRTIPTRGLACDLDGFAAAAGPETRLVFLCNPNNPTGLSFTHDALAALLGRLSPRTLVVIDEAYREYAAAADFPDTVALLGEFPNLIVVRTFSKAHGLAALRVGYAIARPAIVEGLGRVKMPYSVNLLAQKAAVAALEDQEHLRRTLRLNGEEKTSLAAALDRLGCRVLPSEANFLCFAPPAAAGEICEAVLRDGVIVRSLAHFGLPEWIRVSVGKPEENAHFLEALGRQLARG
jgi:histidinol-phosphate aminotransferase